MLFGVSGACGHASHGTGTKHATPASRFFGFAPGHRGTPPDASDSTALQLVLVGLARSELQVGFGRFHAKPSRIRSPRPIRKHPIPVCLVPCVARPHAQLIEQHHGVGVESLSDSSGMHPCRALIAITFANASNTKRRFPIASLPRVRAYRTLCYAKLEPPGNHDI
jgi:hypothetical protein